MSEHVTVGSAEYHNRLMRAGVRLERDSGGKLTAKRVVRKNGVAEVKDVGKITLGIGEDPHTGHFAPALIKEDGNKVVTPTGPGTTGQLSQEVAAKE